MIFQIGWAALAAILLFQLPWLFGEEMGTDPLTYDFIFN